MKIALLGPAWPYTGGLTHYNIWLSNFLQRREHTVKVFSYKLWCPKFLYPGKKLKDTSQPNLCEFDYINILNSVNPFNWPKAVKEIKKFDPDFLIIYWWTPFLSFMYRFITRRLNATVICLCHNVLPHEKSIIDTFLTKRCFKDVDYFIVHGKQEKKDLMKLMPILTSEDITVTPHPSYDVQFTFEKVSRKAARKKLQVHGKVLLFFGFVREYKGLKYLIKAMPELSKIFPEIQLLVVGEFWKGQKEIIDNFIQEFNLRNVRIVDQYIPDEDVAYFFKAADVVVLPYETATGSGIIQIAFGFNIPVIATNVGTLDEIVKHKKTGLIIPPKNPNAIISAVIDFYKKYNQNEFIKEIKKDSYRFSWDKLVDEIEHIGEKSRN